MYVPHKNIIGQSTLFILGHASLSHAPLSHKMRLEIAMKHRNEMSLMSEFTHKQIIISI